MRAVCFDEFGVLPVLRDVADPEPSAAGVVVRVEATGLCRSDWHGWLGHDDGITLPHVPGHELVGVIDAAGPLVTRFAVGQRVTVPFVCACGDCPECASGNAQVCRNQTQPGFTQWGPTPKRWPCTTPTSTSSRCRTTSTPEPPRCSAAGSPPRTAAWCTRPSWRPGRPSW